MIPILHGARASDFSTWGICPLSDTVSCQVEEERNGAFTLTAVIPASSPAYKNLEKDMIVTAKCWDDEGLPPVEGISAEQPFRIYELGKPINGKVTIKAEHIALSAARYTCVLPFETATRLWSDIPKANTTPLVVEIRQYDGTHYYPTLKTPRTAKDYLGGMEGSILDHLHCEYVFDGYTANALPARGEDRGVEIRYGRDLTDYLQTENILQAYTGIFPFYYKDENGVVTYVAPSSPVLKGASPWAYHHIQVMDATEDFQNSVPTAARLKTWAQNKINAPGWGDPDINIKVNLVPIWSAINAGAVPGSVQFYDTTRLRLCDTCHVYFDRMGIEATGKVVKTTYDVLKERLTAVQIGNAKPSLPKTVAGLLKKTKEVIR